MKTNKLIVGNASETMEKLLDGSVDLIITSPPYWNAVEYEKDQISTYWDSYESYLDEMMLVWTQCERVLRPNGKLCINTPIMPIPKSVIGDQHTRHIKNIAFDMENTILEQTSLLRYSLFIWQKQTEKMMFGSYPYPGNILENNTVEFINVYVKPGKPPKFDKEQKEANKLSRSEWLDLTQQVWFMYPERSNIRKVHPAPFPQKLPARLIRLYSYGGTESHEGEIVLDPFAGTGTTCLVAKKMNRRFIGIDQSQTYINIAKKRISESLDDYPVLLTGRPSFPNQDVLVEEQESEPTLNKKVERYKNRAVYGRGVEKSINSQVSIFDLFGDQ